MGLLHDRRNTMDNAIGELNQVSPLNNSQEMLTASTTQAAERLTCRRLCCCGDEQFREFSQETTLHGIRYTTNTSFNLYRRLLWIALMLFTIILLIFAVKDSAIRYSTDPVTTVTTFQHHTEVTFPAITLCNYNQYRKSVIGGTWFEDFLKELFTAPAPQRRQINGLHDYEDRLRNMNRTEFEIKAAHRIEDMILECVWSSTSNCDESNFTLVLTDFGVCYTFNGDPNNILLVRNRGSLYGLQVLLNIQQIEYTVGRSMGAGMKLLVHSQTDVPLVGEFGMSLHPGMDITVALKMGKNELLKCSKEELKYFEEYSSPNCQLERYTDAVLSSCNCTEPYMPGHGRTCDYIDSITCATRAKEQEEFSCKMPCETVSHASTLSFGAFPGVQVTEQLKNRFNMTEKSIEQNFVSLNIYVEDLMVLVTSEVMAYTYDDFVGDLGGQIGLFLGASLLTVFEFAEFFVTCVVRRCRRLRAKFRAINKKNKALESASSQKNKPECTGYKS